MTHPLEAINNLIGYRYYSDNQLTIYKNIKLLQNVGFTLKEIKLILESTEKDTLYNCVKKLIIDYQDKLQTLEELKTKIRGEEKIQLIEKSNFVIVGEYKELSTRESFIDKLQKIDEGNKLKETGFVSISNKLLFY